MADDFIITIHALHRMSDRFPEIADKLDDREVGEFIHREFCEAMDKGRSGKVAPLELSHWDPDRWVASKKDGFVVWTADKKRGYVMQGSDEGILVVTVLAGTPRRRRR